MWRRGRGGRLRLSADSRSVSAQASPGLRRYEDDDDLAVASRDTPTLQDLVVLHAPRCAPTRHAAARRAGAAAQVSSQGRRVARYRPSAPPRRARGPAPGPVSAAARDVPAVELVRAGPYRTGGPPATQGRRRAVRAASPAPHPGCARRVRTP